MPNKQKKNFQVDKGRNSMEKAITEPCFLFCLVIFGIILTYTWLAYLGNGLQKYTDIVCEFTSIWNSNKSGEINLTYVMALLGTAAIFIFYGFKNTVIKGLTGAYKHSSDDKRTNVITVALLVASATYYFVYTGTNPVLISMLLLLVFFYVADKTFTTKGIVIFVTSLYAISGIYRFYIYLGGDKTLHIMTVVVLSSLISLLLFITANNKGRDLFAKVFLLEQLLIPLTLLIFLSSSYKYRGEIKQLALPDRITWGIWILIAFFLLFAFLELKKRWRTKFEIEEAITFGTLCSIVNFNNYSGSGQIVSWDLHHPFENIIGFSQAFELGRKLFTEYIPVSGMYSLLHGYFLYFFGEGYYAYYYVTENIFYLTISGIIVFLLRRQLNNYWILLISLLIPVMRYNRVALIIPIMILLTWPKLIKNRNLWLKAWVLTSLLNGLYYPVYGAAVCIGFLPLAIYQSASYLKTNLLSDMKKKEFWIDWAACLLPVLLCTPLLLGTLKHMIAMASQTVYADGISRFGQTLPDYFFAYIQHMGVRLLAYDAFTFVIQASVVWTSAILAMKIGRVSFKNKRVKSKNLEAVALCLSFGIAVMVAFSFTLIRIDLNSLYARSAGIIFASSLMIILLCARYIRKPAFLYAAVGIAVFFVAVVSEEAVFNINSANKLEPYYSVGDNYVFVADGHVPRLGTCFMTQGGYNEILAKYNETRHLNPTQAYLGIGSFGHYYLSHIKGASTLEIGTIKGYNATQETVDLMRKNASISTCPDSFTQYYFYHWLLMSGEYVWSARDGKFFPNKRDIPVGEVHWRHKNTRLVPEGRGLGRTPTSWGSSMDSLEEIFTAVTVSTKIIQEDASTKIVFDKTIKGEDADFVYIEFDGMDQSFTDILFNHFTEFEPPQEEISWFNEKLMKRDYNRGTLVTILWNDDHGNQHSMNCNMGRGKLLIPLGSGRDWLLNNHNSLTFTITKGGKTLPVPNVKKVEMLKVREVR